MNRTRWLIGVAAVLALAGLAGAQGLIIDRRPDMPVEKFYRVDKVAVTGTIRDQVAEIQVSQTLHNPQRRPIEAEFFFPLPDGGAVQDFTLMVDGKELPGRLLTAEQARRIYEEIVRRRKDPALLEYVGRGLLKTSVFPIPAGKSRTISLHYTQLCQRDADVVRFTYPLSTHKHADQDIRQLSIDLRLVSAEPIKSVYSPSHEIDVKRRGKREARVRYTAHDIRPGDDFRLFYDLADQAIGATVLSCRPDDDKDGYFLLLASPGFTPPDARPLAKTVICVLDKSGSMTGKKIEQARNALQFVLRHLNDDDTFNIITYNDCVDAFKPELQRCTKKTRDQALDYVAGIRAGGSTNIDLALRRALRMIGDADRPAYVLFLTDGLPTAGEQNEMNIARNCAKANRHHARLIAFGVGHDVNARLLDRLTTGNGGVSEYVRPEENIEAAVSRFYSRITAPVLSDIAITYKGTTTNRVYPKQMPDLFEDQQCVVVGRYTRSGKVRITLSGKVGAKKQTFHYKATLADEKGDAAYAFVEKLWAQRRIGHLIDQIDLHGKNAELIAELVELSRKYGILTPYTSFLADERTDLADREEILHNAAKETDQLAELSGSSGVYQRAAKQAYKASSAVQTAPTAALPSGTFAAGNAPLERQRLANVRNIANRSFLRRGDCWIQADLAGDQQRHAIEVKQFSPAYFDLIDRIDRDNQYLVFKEDVIVELEGKVYHIRQ